MLSDDVKDQLWKAIREQFTAHVQVARNHGAVQCTDTSTLMQQFIKPILDQELVDTTSDDDIRNFCTQLVDGLNSMLQHRGKAIMMVWDGAGDFYRQLIAIVKAT